MIGNMIFFAHYTLLLLYGILLSLIFAGIKFTKKNLGMMILLFVICGLSQVFAYLSFNEIFVWKIYPLITHLPLLLFLCLYYHKRLVTAISAITTAYLFCQPAKWFGLLFESLTADSVAGRITRIIVLAATGFFVLRYLAAYFSDIFNKDSQSVLIFGIVPIIYYIFDYSMSIYTDFWNSSNRTAAEFLPFFLCVVYILFCIVYYHAYEQKADAERKEQMIHITVEQQAKEIEAIRRSEQEIRLLRHDMRFFLSSLALCLEESKQEKALQMIASYIDTVEATSVKRYCSNVILNCVLSDIAAKCAENHIHFDPVVELDDFRLDEIMFSSIVSNALDNALNAQKRLPENERFIKLMLKNSNGKILLSIKNPFDTQPIFSDDLPISTKPNHGYGTQSIRYMTERLGGNCQFIVEDKLFVLRVVI